MTTTVTKLYFGPSGVGLADGSSWDNRAPLDSGTNWSPYITSFPFSINNILHVYIGSGTYSISQTMRKSSFTTPPPESSNSLHFIGCDESGNAIVPDYSWRSCDGVEYDYSSWPLLSNCVLNENDGTSNLWYNLRTLRIQTSASRVAYKASRVDWCFIRSTSTSTSMVGLQECDFISNCIFQPSTSFNSQIVTATYTLVENCLLLPPASISGGNAAGVYSEFGLTGFTVKNSTIIGYKHGIYNTVSSTTCKNNTIYNCKDYGIRSTSSIKLNDNYIHATGIGVSVLESGTNAQISHNRIMGNTIISGSGYLKYNFDNYLSSGDVYSELTDPDNNDLSIKTSSVYYNQNIGAGDAISNSGGAANYYILRRNS